MELTNTLNFAKNPFRFFYQTKVPIAHQGLLYHMHQGMELFYVHQGTARAVIESQIVEIGPGTLLYFPPFQLHGIRLENNVHGALVRSVFEFDPLALEPYVKPFSSLQSFFYQLWKNQTAPTAVMAQITPGSDWSLQLGSQLAQLNALRETSEYEEHYALTILTLLKSVQPLWTKHFEPIHRSSRPQNNAEYVMEWVDAHYNEEFSLKALSKELHLSEKHISTLFRRVTGTSITEYLMAKRLKQACRLLASTTDSIEQVAYEVGLTNLSYFCQFFKRRIGMTPSEFRKQFTRHG